MPQQRIKGQSTVISVLLDGSLQAKIDTIKSCEITYELETTESDYLGETVTRYDTLFKGMSIKIEGDMTSRQVIDVTDSIVKRAQNRVGGAVRIDIATTFLFPNGDIVTINIPDVQFDSIPINTGGRKEYVSFTWTGKAGEYDLL